MSTTDFCLAQSWNAFLYTFNHTNINSEELYLHLDSNTPVLKTKKVERSVVLRVKRTVCNILENWRKYIIRLNIASLKPCAINITNTMET